jgi:hypothetical protein
MNPRVVLSALLLVTVGTAPARGDSADAVLDALHEAGAASEPAGFFAQMTPGTVVLGVDGAGLLEGPVLRTHFEERFAAGNAWDYRSTARSIRYSTDGDMAWFTESLESPDGGHGWGSGVVTRTAAGWRVAQYSVITASGSTGTASAPARQESEATPAAGQQERKRCRRMRHKTNKVSNC